MTPYSAKLISAALLCAGSLIAAAISAKLDVPSRTKLPDGQMTICVASSVMSVISGAAWFLTLLSGPPKNSPPQND